jgi:hypothetical protein
MRSLLLSLMSVGLLGLSGCAASLQSESQAKWATGFWFWNGSSTEVSPASGTLDALFVQAGTIRQRSPLHLSREAWSVEGKLPGDLPPGKGVLVRFSIRAPAGSGSCSRPDRSAGVFTGSRSRPEARSECGRNPTGYR